MSEAVARERLGLQALGAGLGDTVLGAVGTDLYRGVWFDHASGIWKVGLVLGPGGEPRFEAAASAVRAIASARGLGHALEIVPGTWAQAELMEALHRVLAVLNQRFPHVGFHIGPNVVADALQITVPSSLDGGRLREVELIAADERVSTVLRIGGESLVVPPAAAPERERERTTVRLTRARRRGHVLVVAGLVADDRGHPISSAAQRVSVVVAGRGGRASRPLRLLRGRFSARITVPPRLRNSPLAISVRYAGDDERRPATTRRHLR